MELPKKPTENIMSPIISLSRKSILKQESYSQSTSCKSRPSDYLSLISSASLSPSHKLRLCSRSPVSKSRPCSLSLSPVLMSGSSSCSLSPIRKPRSKSRSPSPVHSSRSYSKSQNNHSQSVFSKSKSKAKKLVRCTKSNFPMDEARKLKKFFLSFID